MTRKLALAVAILLTTTACPYNPISQVRQTEERPGILVQGAPYDSVLVVDGLYAGPVLGSDGRPQIIRIEPGMHDLLVAQGGHPLMGERVFVSGAGVKTLTFSGSGLPQ
jgi:hypothetical protein